MSRGRVALLGAVLAVLALASSGCEVGTDDEMAPTPRRTVTASPTQSSAPAPATVPVGNGDVSPADAVFAQGSVLHVGSRAIDLSPVEVSALVVVRGGVFVLAEGGELWFTDLARLRGTAQTEVTGLQVDAAADLLQVVDERSGSPLSQGYDTRTGRAVQQPFTPRTDEDRLGAPVGVALGERLRVGPAGTGIAGRQGPGRYGVATTDAGAPVVFDAEGSTRVPVRGLPARLELAGWSGEEEFYALDRVGGAPRAVVSCDVAASRCTRLARVDAGTPVVFGTGT